MRVPRRTGGSLICSLAVALSLIGLAPPTHASLMRFLSVEELAGASTQVVRARILGQSVHWTEDRRGIVTRIEAVVTGPLKGDAAAGRRLTIVQAGGVIDGISLDWSGRPTFREGEDLVLFLQPYDPADPADLRLLVVGGKQGRMRVLEDPAGRRPPQVERDLAGVLEAPFIEGELPEGPAVRRDTMDLDELRRRVEGPDRRAPR